MKIGLLEQDQFLYASTMCTPHTEGIRASFQQLEFSFIHADSLLQPLIISLPASV